jgi:DNA-binding NarL/FixJ family response regulator
MELTSETMTATIRLLIVDDHQMVRDGIRVMLESQDRIAGFDVTEADSGEDGLQKVLKQDFDIIMVDYQLPRMSGAETVEKILTYKPEAKILALSNYDELSYINKMISAGAKGYVLKNIEPSQLITAIETVLNGKSYYSNEVAVKLIDGDRQPRQKAFPLEYYGITRREMEILKMIAKEMTNEEIAAKLLLSKRTVDSHRQNLINKLHVKNTVGLIKIAFELKLI